MGCCGSSEEEEERLIISAPRPVSSSLLPNGANGGKEGPVVSPNRAEGGAEEPGPRSSDSDSSSHKVSSKASTPVFAAQAGAGTKAPEGVGEPGITTVGGKGRSPVLAQPVVVAKKQKGEKKAKKEKKSFFSRLFSSDAPKESEPSIGGPTGFRHQQHISWSPDKGFDLRNIPDEWRALFSKAGVTEADLRNRKTALFIMNFVAASLGQQSSPYSKARGPQPAEQAPATPPLQTRNVSQEYTSFNQIVETQGPLPASMMPTSPLADSSLQIAPSPSSPAPAPQATPTRRPPTPPSRAGRAVLSPSQPPAPPPPPAPVPPPRDSSLRPPDSPLPTPPRPPARAAAPADDSGDSVSLLEAIRARGGKSLRKVEAAPDLKKLSKKDEDSLAGALAKALEARRAFLKEHAEDEEGDSTEASEWD